MGLDSSCVLVRNNIIVGISYNMQFKKKKDCPSFVSTFGLQCLLTINQPTDMAIQVHREYVSHHTGDKGTDFLLNTCMELGSFKQQL